MSLNDLLKESFVAVFDKGKLDISIPTKSLINSKYSKDAIILDWAGILDRSGIPMFENDIILMPSRKLAVIKRHENKFVASVNPDSWKWYGELIIEEIKYLDLSDRDNFKFMGGQAYHYGASIIGNLLEKPELKEYIGKKIESEELYKLMH